MKKSTDNKIRLGVFVTVGLLLLIAGIYVIGARRQMFNSTIHISGVFKDVGGLQVGNNVRFSGITIGTVENIEIITDTSVKVDLMIDSDVKKFIKRNATAGISSDGLMGNKLITISPGTEGEAEIEDHAYIATSMPIDMDAIMVNLKSTTDNAAMITYDLAAIMSNIRYGKGTIGKLFNDTTFAETLDETMVNLKEGAGGFKENMDAAGDSFLLRGAKKKKEKEAEKKKEEREEEKKKK